MWALVLAFTAVASFVPGSARAQEFSRVDFFQGSLVNSGRVIGLGGAFISDDTRIVLGKKESR